jgi:hypothetical protein
MQLNRPYDVRVMPDDEIGTVFRECVGEPDLALRRSVYKLQPPMQRYHDAVAGGARSGNVSEDGVCLNVCVRGLAFAVLARAPRVRKDRDRPPQPMHESHGLDVPRFRTAEPEDKQAS